MEEKYIFIDCDGVILDSEQRMNKKKEERGYLNHNDGKEFDDYFKLADSIEGEWEYIIEGASSLNSSVEIIRELEKMKRKLCVYSAFQCAASVLSRVDFPAPLGPMRVRMVPFPTPSPMCSIRGVLP